MSRTLDQILDAHSALEASPKSEPAISIANEKLKSRTILFNTLNKHFNEMFREQMETIIYGAPLNRTSHTVPDTVPADYEARAAEYAASSKLKPGPPVEPKQQTALGTPKESFSIQNLNGKQWGDGI